VDRAKIEDVKRLRNFTIASALALVLSMFGWWSYRELGLRYAQRKYSREFKPGTKRQVVENRLLAEGIRFFPESPNVDFVPVGNEVRYSLVCAPREAGLLLEFQTQDGTSSGDEILQRVEPVREKRGCM
jgi:hypothetical protein